MTPNSDNRAPGKRALVDDAPSDDLSGEHAAVAGALPERPQGRSTAGKRQLTVEVKRQLRALTNEVTLLNREVGSRVSLSDVDFATLDLIAQDGPLSPSEVARRAGLHKATVTGVLDRLERSGWVVRERDAEDRRAVRVRMVPDRAREVFAEYAGMNASMDALCADYDVDQLRLIADFLRRTAEAGRLSTERLAGD